MINIVFVFDDVYIISVSEVLILLVIEIGWFEMLLEVYLRFENLFLFWEGFLLR